MHLTTRFIGFLMFLLLSSMLFSEEPLKASISANILMGDLEELKRIEKKSPENKRIILDIARKMDSDISLVDSGDQLMLDYLYTLGFKEAEPKTLFEAIERKKPIFVKKLLKNGAKVNAKNKNGKTPLIKAGNYNNVEVIKTLLDAGAKIDAQDNDGYTTLINASYQGHDKVVDFLLKKGANPNIKSKAEFTALRYAIQEEKPLIVKLLLKNGAKVNAKDKDGKTPLIEAGYYNNVEVIKTLLDAGAKIDAQDNDGDTALINASYYGHDKVVEFLLKKGANPNIKSKAEFTALRYAIQEEKPLIVKLLLKNGAKVNAKNKNGKTPLMRAGYYNNVEVMKTLLDAGAKIDAQDNDGYTTLIRASWFGKDKVVEFLLKNGANPNIESKDKLKLTALDAAIDNNDLGTLFLLQKSNIKEIKKSIRESLKDNYKNYAIQVFLQRKLSKISKKGFGEIEFYINMGIRFIKVQYLYCGLSEYKELKECTTAITEGLQDKYKEMKKYSNIEDIYSLVKQAKETRYKNKNEFIKLDDEVDKIMKRVFSASAKSINLIKSLENRKKDATKKDMEQYMKYMEIIISAEKEMETLINDLKNKHNLKLIDADYTLLYLHQLNYEMRLQVASM